VKIIRSWHPHALSQDLFFDSKMIQWPYPTAIYGEALEVTSDPIFKRIVLIITYIIFVYT